MPRWFVLLALPLVLGFACVTATATLRELDPATQAARAEAARHDAAMNAIAEAEAEQRARILAPALALAGALLAVGGSGVLVVLLAVYVYHRWRFVDVAGVSVSRQLALEGATLPAMLMTVSTNGQARIEAARNPAPALPPGLRSYSPRYANREATPPRQPQALPAQATPTERPAVAVPTLAQVLATRPAREVVVGYERNGDALALGLDAIGATLVVGQRRTGKSNTVAVLTAQLVAMRAQVFGVDPHAQAMSADSLARRLAPLGNRVALWASTPAEAEGVLRAVTSELERRIAGEEGDPCILLVDELHSLTFGPWAEVGAEVTRLAQRLAEEGGKLAMGMIAAAQIPNVDSLGGHLAYTASTVVVHQAVPDTVRRFVGRDLARQAPTLARGQVLVKHPGGWGILSVPRAEPSDLAQAVMSLPALGGGTTTGDTGGATSEQVVDAATSRRHRIQELASLGYSRNRISQEIFGHKDEGTLNEIRAVLGPVEG